MLLSGTAARSLVRQSFVMQRQALATLNKSGSNLLKHPMMQPCALTRFAASDSAVQWPESHASHFKIERLWAAAMIPLIPAAYFIHGPFMDAALAASIALHTHWGIQGVVQDYARPFVIGDTMAKAARASVYVITGLLLAGLFHFNYNDVGLTKAFEMVWSL